MPRVAPGFHVADPPTEGSVLVYDHPAAEVAQAMPGWFRFHDKCQPFRQVLVEWAPDPAHATDAVRSQSALLCNTVLEPDEAAPYVGRFDCALFTYRGGSDWTLLQVMRGGQVAHEIYWGPDHTAKLLDIGLQPPPLDPGEIAVTVNGDQVRYKGPLRDRVCALATEVKTSWELVDRLCREIGVGVPDPLHFPDVDYTPEPGDDRAPQLTEDVVDCWIR